MKKVFAFLLASVLLCSACVAEGLDYSSMSNEQLHTVVDMARNELVKRELIATQNTVLFDQDGVQMYMTGDYTVQESSISDDVFFKISVVVINNTDRNIGINIENSSVNGWDVSSAFLSGVSAQKKRKDEITLNVVDAEVKSVDDLQEVTIAFSMYDESTYDTFANIAPVTLYFNAK